MSTEPQNPTSAIDSASSSSPRVLEIEHAYAEGTLLTGIRRHDDLYTLLRSLGWLHRRSVGDYRLQASQDRPAKTGAIRHTAEQLRARGFIVTVTIATTARPVEEAEAALADRAQDRAERLHHRAARLQTEAAARERAANNVLDHIPLGQPMLVDHPRYGADRNRRERAFANLERSADLEREARETAAAADTAARRMDHRHNPHTVVNRIEKLEAELRRIPRDRAAHLRRAAGAPNLEYTERLDEQEAHARDQLAHWTGIREQQVLDGAATNYGRGDVACGDMVLYESTWYPVIRVNAKSVSIPSRVGGSSWTDTVRFTHIRDIAGADDPRRDGLVALAVEQARLMAGKGRPMHPAWTALT